MTRIHKAHILVYRSGPSGLPLNQAVAIGDHEGRDFVMDLTGGGCTVMPRGDHTFTRSEERHILAAFKNAVKAGELRPVLKDFTNFGGQGRWYAEREAQGALLIAGDTIAPVLDCLKPFCQKPSRRSV